MKNPPYGINELDIAEETFSTLENTAIETSKNKKIKHKERRLKKMNRTSVICTSTLSGLIIYI